jgi:Flp pilus assembly protein TadG
MALVTPFLLLILFGIGEFGLAWVSANKLEGAVSTAARVGSVQGGQDGADAAILASLRASMPDELIDNVERVVIFRSNAAGDIGGLCLTAGAGGGVSSGSLRCNIYDAATLSTAVVGMTLNDNDWEPNTRNDNLSDPPDYIGVLVVTTHDDVSGTFWRDGFELTRRSVYRIQPDIDG